MVCSSKRSIGSRLAILVLMALMPAVIIIIAAAWEKHHDAMREAEVRALGIARDMASQYSSMVTQTQTLLDTLTQLHQLQNHSPKDCSTILTEMLAHNPILANLQEVAPDGTIRAAAIPPPTNTFNISDRSYFQECIKTKKMATGEYFISSSVHRPVLHFAQPMLDDNGAIIGVLVAALDLSNCNQIFTNAHLPPKAVMVLTDRKGKRLYRSLDNERYMGVPDLPEMIARMTGPKVDGAFLSTGVDGINRLYGFRQIRLEPYEPPYLYLRVGVPSAPIIANVNAIMLRRFAFLGLAAIMAFGVAWILGNRGLVKPICQLASAAKRLGEGDLAARSGLPHTPNEMGLLAKVFDEMGGALETRARERERAENALRLTQFAMDHSSQGILWLTPQGNITYFNDAFAKLINIPTPTLHAKNICDLPFGFTPQSWTESWETIKNNHILSRELSLESNPIEALTVEFIANHVTFDNRELCIAYFRDITEQRRAEGRMRQAHKMEAVGALAAGVAHDFNNALTGILGHASILLADTPSDSETYKSAEAIEQAASRAATLTRQLLGFSRKGKHLDIPIDINGQVQEAINLLSRTIDKSIVFEHRFGAETAWTRGDPAQIQQVIINLAVNARDAMPQGGRIILETCLAHLDELYCQAHPGAIPGDYIALHVTDTGCGIPKSIQDRIFEPFFTTKEPGKGTGMGLATVYGIIKNHGGSVQLYSEIGQGTRFTIYLPQRTPEGATLPPAPIMAIPAGTGRILLVDDEDSVRNLEARVLNKLGYTVESIASPEVAVDFFRRHEREVDLLILDLNMPGMGGRECLVAMREINPAIPALLATGYARDGKAQEVIDLGHVGFIQKPFRMHELAQAVASVLPGQDPPQNT